MYQANIHNATHHIDTYLDHPSVNNIIEDTAPMSLMESNSCSSISPTERVDLTDPQSYLISTGSGYLMTDYDSCPSHTYSTMNPPGMMYVPSSPDEHQIYMASHEAFGTTSSPTPTINSASFHQFSSHLPFSSSSKELSSEELELYSDSSNYGYNRAMFSYRPSCSPNDSLSSMEATLMVPTGDQHRGNKRNPDNSYHYSKETATSIRYHNEAQEKKNGHVKRHSQTKTKKRCSNCSTLQTPSWRRSISKPTKGDLLCNACGL